jgi:hypothetical protein
VLLVIFSWALLVFLIIVFLGFVGVPSCVFLGIVGVPSHCFPRLCWCFSLFLS